MDLTKFLLLNEGTWVRAMAPISAALQEQAENLHEQGQFSPWTVQLGKTRAQISLYRHVLDVAQIAGRLYWYSWQSGLLPGLAVNDEERSVDVLRALLLIAFTHDADKVKGAPSHSPTLAEVREAARQLKAEEWASDEVWGGYSSERLHTAVSIVENRGLGMSLVGPPLPKVVLKLAELVHEADALMAHGDHPESLVRKYNTRLPVWHERYGIPNDPMRLVSWRDEPPVLHRLRQTLRQVLQQNKQIPLVLWQEGSRLFASLPETVRVEEVLKRLEERIAEAPAKIFRRPTTAKGELVRVTSAEQLKRISEEDPMPGLLTVHRDDYENAARYAAFWVLQAGDGLSVVQAKNTGTYWQLIKPGDRLASDMPVYKRALLFAAAMLDDDESITRVLQWKNGVAGDGLLENGVDINAIQSDVSKKTILAMHSALIVGEFDEEAWVDVIHGPFPEENPAWNIGAYELVRQLADQQGIKWDKGKQHESRPYTITDNHGACVLCGTETDGLIQQTMDLLGVKSSAFNGRMGHMDSIWSGTNRNYICLACQKRQEFWVRDKAAYEANRKVDADSRPLVVSTPIRSWLYQPSVSERASRARIVRSVDMSFDEWSLALPWNTTAQLTLPLNWEPVLQQLDEVVRQVRDLALYALYSGEPVHAFVATSHETKGAFLYESLPESLRKLLSVAQPPLMTESGAINRTDLPRFVQTVNALCQLLNGTMSDGRTAYESIGAFGWWPVAWALWADLTDKWYKSKTAGQVITVLREVYPMGVTDESVRNVASAMAVLQHFDMRKGASTNQWGFAMREVLDFYEQWARLGDREVVAKAVGDHLYEVMDRRDMISYLVKNSHDTHAMCVQVAKEIMDICWILEPKSGRLSASQKRFFIAAYQAYLWELKHTNTKEEKTLEGVGN